MLETLGTAATVREAAVNLAAYYGRPLSEIEDDLYEFCINLCDHGLVEADEIIDALTLVRYRIWNMSTLSTARGPGGVP